MFAVSELGAAVIGVGVAAIGVGMAVVGVGAEGDGELVFGSIVGGIGPGMVCVGNGNTFGVAVLVPSIGGPGVVATGAAKLFGNMGIICGPGNLCEFIMVIIVIDIICNIVYWLSLLSCCWIIANLSKSFIETSSSSSSPAYWHGKVSWDTCGH